jgi:hypothetical protein
MSCGSSTEILPHYRELPSMPVSLIKTTMPHLVFTLRDDPSTYDRAYARDLRAADVLAQTLRDMSLTMSDVATYHVSTPSH